MTVHSGDLALELKQAERIGLFWFPNTSTTVDVNQIAEQTGTHAYQAKVDTSQAHQGEHAGELAGEVIFYKVYVLPAAIDAGFIFQDVEDEILIWNADPGNNAIITNIQKINDTGVILDSPSTPITLERFSDQIHQLTIEKEGPPLQDTTFIYTIGGEAFEVGVEGKRLMLWLYEPNWSGKVAVKYRFQTVLSRNIRFTEQRRALLDTPLKTMTAEFLFSGLEHQRFTNDLKKLVLFTLAVPLYSEPIIPAEDLQGKITFSTSDLGDLYNLNNMVEYVIIKKISDNKTAEVQEIDSIGVNSITLQAAVIEDYQEGDTVIYPAFIGIITSKRPLLYTDKVSGASIEFREIA